jgi:hypothetical protein
LSKLPLTWTKHLREPTQRENFEAVLRNSTLALTRLHQIITEKEESLSSTEASLETYKDAGWPYLQAHINGRKAELKELKALLDFIKL